MTELAAVPHLSNQTPSQPHQRLVNSMFKGFTLTLRYDGERSFGTLKDLHSYLTVSNGVLCYFLPNPNRLMAII